MKIRESTGRKNRKKKDLVNVRTDVLEKEKEEQLSHIPYVQKKKTSAACIIQPVKPKRTYISPFSDYNAKITFAASGAFEHQKTST